MFRISMASSLLNFLNEYMKTRTAFKESAKIFHNYFKPLIYIFGLKLKIGKPHLFIS